MLKPKLPLKITGILLLILLGIIPTRIALALHQSPKPQAILVLRGSRDRLRYTTKFAQTHPNFDIWVSGGYRSSKEFKSIKNIFQKSGIPEQKVNYDLCATDTVTNFTCTVDDFVAEDIQHIYLITSDYHMARSKVIATLVLGSRGIVITPIEVESKGMPSESWLRITRDGIRSIIWLATGRSGASFNPRLKARKEKVNNKNKNFLPIP
ncbi:MAG: YdcF family protein [Rivularia sp. (in: Bacteria)]|nr:YdcF family protein [Rivularia sp. MS3]